MQLLAAKPRALRVRRVLGWVSVVGCGRWFGGEVSTKVSAALTTWQSLVAECSAGFVQDSDAAGQNALCGFYVKWAHCEDSCSGCSQLAQKVLRLVSFLRHGRGVVRLGEALSDRLSWELNAAPPLYSSTVDAQRSNVVAGCVATDSCSLRFPSLQGVKLLLVNFWDLCWGHNGFDCSAKYKRSILT